MKKVALISVTIVSVVVLTGCGIDTRNDGAMGKNDDAMMRMEGDAMMRKGDKIHEESMKNDGEAMMKVDAGERTMVHGYTDYNESAVKTALSSGKKVALFFAASWCPTCHALDKELPSEKIPDDTVIFKVDYDNSSDMKKEYGVTTQHTIVTIDKDMKMIKKQIGSKNLAEIKNLF